MNDHASPPLVDFADMSDPQRQYWESIEQGQLSFQRCEQCSHVWLPPREQCPQCWENRWSWDPSGGRGKIITWVVYHRAFHQAFADRVPYNVAIVELDEGPRVVTSILGDHSELRADAPVRLVIVRSDGIALALFELDR